MTDYGKMIKEFRKMKKLSQEQFGYMIGTTQRTVSYWETNQHEVPEEFKEKIDNIIKGTNNKNNIKDYKQLMKDLRELKNFNQAQMGYTLGVSQTTVSRWELGAYDIPDEIKKELDMFADRWGLNDKDKHNSVVDDECEDDEEDEEDDEEEDTDEEDTDEEENVKIDVVDVEFLLNKYRKDHNISREQLADNIGCTVKELNYILKTAKKQYNIDTIKKIITFVMNNILTDLSHDLIVSYLQF